MTPLPHLAVPLSPQASIRAGAIKTKTLGMAAMAVCWRSRMLARARVLLFFPTFKVKAHFVKH